MPDEAVRALHLPLGPAGSGRLRHAAAMAHHARGALSNTALEAFRVLAPRDRDDPAWLLKGERLPELAPLTPVEQVERLRLELLDLLRRLRGPGVTKTRRALAAAGEPVATFDRVRELVEPWLTSALAALAVAKPTLARALAESAPHLLWKRYDYSGPGIGPAFPSGHAFCTLAGEADGPFRVTGLDIGLFVMAPGLFYRDHAHPAPELYLPLTGPHRWRFAPDAPLVKRAALDPIWNEPEAPHVIKVGPVPFLALYAWLDRAGDAAWVVPASDWARHEGPA